MGSLFCAVGRKEGVAGANRRESCQKGPAGKTSRDKKEGVAGPKGRKEAKRPRWEDEWKQERGCSGA